MVGAFLLWQGRAAAPELPPAPEARAVPPPTQPLIPNAPSADARSKEEKRFARVDKNDDGRIRLAEIIEPRRKPFAKLDLDRDGKLLFEEWAMKTIDKFEGADSDQNKALTPAEFATTAPKRKSKPACSCG